MKQETNLNKIIFKYKPHDDVKRKIKMTYNYEMLWYIALMASLVFGILFASILLFAFYKSIMELLK